MKKRGFSRILALALCLGLLTPYGYAAQERASGAEYAAQQARANVITVSHLGDLRSAVQRASNGDVIVLEGFGTVNAFNDAGDEPWIIDKNVTIKGKQKGEWTPSVSVRPGGIILAADVTFEDVEISFANRARNIIMANGHKLTLHNVTHNTSAGAKSTNLACGGLTDNASYSAVKVPQPGNHGEIVISGKTILGNIYAGSIAYADWYHQVGADNQFDGSATITVRDLENGSQLGSIYASGAQETPIDPSQMLNPNYEVARPVGDADKYRTTGKVQINLLDSAAREIDGAAGNGAKADISLETVSLNNTLKLKNVGNLAVNKGDFKPTMAAEDTSLGTANVTVASGATLDFQGMENKTIGSFNGDGTIILGASDTLTITGAATGNTKVAIGGINNAGDASSGLAAFDHPYVVASNASTATFTLLPNNAQHGMMLENDGQGNWRVPKRQKPPVKVKSARIDQDVYVSVDENFAQIPVRATYAYPDQVLEKVPVDIYINGDQMAVQDNGAGGYIYTSDKYKIDEMVFAVVDGPTGDPMEVLELVWYSGITAGAYKIDLVIPASHTVDKQEIKLSTYLTITDSASADKNLSTAQLTLSGSSFEYNGKAHEPTVTVMVGDQTLTQDQYELHYASNTNVGEASVTVVAKANSGYVGSKTQKFTITPAELTLTDVEVEDKVYDGNANASLNKITLHNKSNVAVQLQEGKDYLANAQFDDANAGENKNVTVMVKLVGEAAQNYKLLQDTKIIPKSIKKDKTAPMHGKMQVTNNLAAEYQYDLEQLLTDLKGDRRYGATTFAVVSGELGAYNVTNKPSVSNTMLHVPIDKVDSADEKLIGTITIAITSENYDVENATIDVEAVNKIVPIGNPTLSTTTLTYGDALSKITLSGSMDDGTGKAVDGEFAWNSPATVYSAGMQQPEWTFMPMDTERYQIVTGTAAITVDKATPTGEPHYTSITTDGKTLADTKINADGGAFSVEGTVKWDLVETTEVQRNTDYDWTFTPKDEANYNVVKGSLTPYVTSGGGGGSSGGGGGGGSIGGGESTNGNHETNPDGSTTTVEKKPDGSTVTTTKHPDGSVNKVETRKDGTAIETNTTANGTVGKIVEDIDGNITEISGKVSSKDAEYAKQTGEPVKVPVKVPVSDSAKQAPSVKVDVPKGGSKVEIPVDQLTAGTVAVIVHRDGTEELVRKSGLTQEGVTLTLEESATFKLVDNSKEFEDVRGYDWHKDAVSFISAHELMNGTSDHTFSPNTTLSRGMLAVIIHNLENNPDAVQDGSLNDIHGGEWYTDAVYWASTKGILSGYEDGTMRPNENITREQLAVMLYRYAGSPSAGHALDGFSDSQQVSSFATSAMTWAVEHGILSGKGNGVLDPRGQATRAEAAQMVMNFMK